MMSNESTRDARGEVQAWYLRSLPPSGISTRRVGVATSIWGVVFAVVHVYWAAGGTIASGTEEEAA